MRNYLVLALILWMLAADTRAAGTTPASPTPTASSSACTVEANLDPFGGWLTQLMHALCASSDSDTLLAAFAVALPGPGSHGTADRQLLDRAKRAGASNIKVLWIASTIDGAEASLLPDICKNALSAANSLVLLDGDNALAWIAKARVAVQCGQPADAQSALNKAGNVARTHDVSFDVIKPSPPRLHVRRRHRHLRR